MELVESFYYIKVDTQLTCVYLTTQNMLCDSRLTSLKNWVKHIKTYTYPKAKIFLAGVDKGNVGSGPVVSFHLFAF